MKPQDFTAHDSAPPLLAGSHPEALSAAYNLGYRAGQQAKTRAGKGAQP